MNPSLDTNTPQFDTAEYAAKETGEVCQFCRVPIGTQYYRVNGQMACVNCSEYSKSKAPQHSAGKFARAVLFGIGGAIAGLILYSTVAIVTGWIIGFVSLAVGFIVGKAMMAGSGGLGGKRYQIVALLLTYAAVSLSAIPIAIVDWRSQDQPAQVEKQATQQHAAAGQEATAEAEEGTEPDAEEGSATPNTIAGVIGYLTLIGLASPFLELAEPKSGIIGLIILFVGLQIAWKTAAGNPGVQVEGPFENVTV